MAKEAERNRQEEEVQEETKEKKTANKPWIKWVIIGVVAVAVLGGGIYGGVLYFSKLSVAKEAAEQPPKPVIGVLWPMDTFIVNLADNDGERYLKLILQLELSDANCASELDQLKPKLRDNVLGLLTTKQFKDVSTYEGKQRLKEEIAMRLNNLLTRGRIVQVYFTDFVVQ